MPTLLEKGTSNWNQSSLLHPRAYHPFPALWRLRINVCFMPSSGNEGACCSFVTARTVVRINSFVANEFCEFYLYGLVKLEDTKGRKTDARGYSLDKLRWKTKPFLIIQLCSRQSSAFHIFPSVRPNRLITVVKCFMQTRLFERKAIRVILQYRNLS